jgi:Concanavalin A-like lectin/glucanases superfamily
MRPRSYILVVTLAAGVVLSALGVARAQTGQTSTAVVVARYGFEGSRAAAVQDRSGNGHNLTVVSRNGGSVHAIAHGSGQALVFPAKCGGTGCPHVALRTPNAADLNPGTRNLSFGAAVHLGRTQTTKGQNVVQKGYSATSSQYKLQVDGSAGRPSCVVVDDRKPTIQLVRSSITVADGAWHTVECRRAGAVLRILVDGVVRGTRRIPATLSVTNTRPLSIGGKGAYEDNDQFQGALDDVWVRIG